MKYLIPAAALALALPGAASALTFDGSWGVSGSAFSDPGLVVKTSPAGNGAFSFDLDDGQSTTQKLFRIWTDETDVSGADTDAKDISVDFSVNGGTGPISGSVEGHSQWYFIFNSQWGSLDWGSPIDLDVGTGILSIALSSVAKFNEGLYGLSEGKRHGGDVYADFSYTASPSQVPLPAGLGLVLAGMGALGFFGIRRSA